jgi:hypothetical protein
MTCWLTVEAFAIADAAHGCVLIRPIGLVIRAFTCVRANQGLR